jgi:hypothetical protein
VAEPRVQRGIERLAVARCPGYDAVGADQLWSGVRHRDDVDAAGGARRELPCPRREQEEPATGPGVLVQPGAGAVVVDELEVGGVPADRILGGIRELVARVHGREQLGEVPVRLRIADATRAAGILVHVVLGRAVEDQSRPAAADEAAMISTIPFPLMARGMRERHASGATVADDFRYALGILLAGLNAARPSRSS